MVIREMMEGADARRARRIRLPELTDDERALFDRLAAQPIVPKPVSQLRPDPLHARIHSDEKFAGLMASIRRSKTLTPFVIDEADLIIDGHLRREIAVALGIAEVPAMVASGLTEAERRALAISLNRFPAWVTWELPKLRVVLTSIVADIPDLAMEEIGFSTVEFDQITSAPAAPNDPADTDIGEPSQDPVSREGDMWLLGGHVVLCGSAREPDNYNRLLGATAVRMVLTDPPYNVRIAGNVTKRKGMKEFAEASGEMSPAEYHAFLQAVFRCVSAVCVDGAISYWFIDWRHAAQMQAAAEGILTELKNVIVWVKTVAAMGTFYRSRHEFVLVYKIGKGKHVNNFKLGQHGRLRSNVWEYPSPHQSGERRDQAVAAHATPKPVAMLHDAILDCSNPGDIVLDVFGGSGSTLIAAERARRRARLMEIDPGYTDLIVQRWQRFTGQRGTLANTGETFAEVAVRRANSAASEAGDMAKVGKGGPAGLIAGEGAP